MSDDSDLTRLFAEASVPADDAAFVTRVSRRVAMRRHGVLILPAVVAALLALAVWATWPVAYAFSGAALAGLVMMAVWIGGFFTSPAGMFVAGVLMLTAALWAWLFERMRGTVS